ncbi:MAG: HisS family protein [Candidatus Gracilibacteria bacterium]|nr:HisS family protein [Candidatus Gracilibacteria bacterium]
MSSKLSNAKNTQDLLPEDHQYYTYIKKVVRHRSRQGGIRRITTPIYENKELIRTLLGDEQFNLLQDSFITAETGKEQYILRPALLFGMLRSYVQYKMSELPKPVELYSFEKAFFKRPGKLNQFDLYSVLIIGEEDPVIDAQLIKLARIIINDLKISNKVSLYFNVIGCNKCLPKYKQDLEQYYYGKEHTLCEKCNQNFAKAEYLALLDCQEEDCQILSKLAPKLPDYVCKDCKHHYERILEFLEALKIKHETSLTLLPKINCYDKVYFEFRYEDKVLIRGGRFDHLIEKLGDDPTPAAGFGMDIPAIVEAMKQEGLKVPFKDNIHVFLAQLGPDAKKKSLPLLYELREAGIKTVGAMGKGSMNQQIDLAHKLHVDYTLILGQMEVREGTIILRDMSKGKQKTMPFAKALPELKKLLGNKGLDKYKEGPDGMLS